LHRLLIFLGKWKKAKIIIFPFVTSKYSCLSIIEKAVILANKRNPELIKIAICFLERKLVIKIVEGLKLE